MDLTPAEYWSLIHTERTRLARLLAELTAQQWHSDSLCTQWNVEQVVAHLTAAANTGTVGWLRSMVLAGFNAARHNTRRMNQYLGGTVQGTEAMYLSGLHNRIAPTRDYAAWLGEVIVHGQDIARPLNLQLEPAPVATLEVARFYAAKDFAVNSHRTVMGLKLEAADADFSVGSGLLVRGPLLSLVMAMAGRSGSCDDLQGAGVAVLRGRSTSPR